MVDRTIIAVYLLITLGIGIYRGLNVKTIRDFAIADRKYATPVLVATIAATATGGGSTMGITGTVYNVGMIYVLVSLGETLYKVLIAQFIAPRMGRFAGMISVGDIMNSFYGKPGRIITGICGTLLSIGFVGAQISALGSLLNYILEIPFLWGVLIGVGIIVIYSTFGGIKAVTATDVIQFGVLIITIPMVCNVALNSIGGYEALFEALPKSHFSLMPNDQFPFTYVELFVLLSIPFLNPAVTQRMLMAKDPAQIRKSMLITAGIEAPFFVLVGLMGLVVFVMNPELSKTGSGMALPYLMSTILPVGLKGLAIAGMLAVIMSTADSYLNTAGIALVHDVIKPVKRKQLSSRVELFITRCATFVIGTLAIFVAVAFESITEILFDSLDFWGPTILVPLLVGIFGFHFKKRYFLTSVLVGLLVFFVWKIFDLKATVGLRSISPSIIACVLVFIGFYIFKGRGDSDESGLDNKADDGGRRVGFGWFSWMGRISNIVELSSQRVSSYGAHYTAFGIFAVVNYIIPYFMWSHTTLAHYELALAFRFAAGLLCFLLVMKSYWPDNLKRFLPIYWHFTLMFCLPFLTTFMLLESGATIAWLFNMALGLFLLSILVDWISFMVILPVGGVLGYLLFTAIGGAPFSIDSDTLYWAGYMYLFAIAIGLIFSRNQENIEREKINTARTLGASIAHEIRTPLSSLRMHTELLKTYLPQLMGYYEGVGEKPKISADHIAVLKKLPQMDYATIQRSFLIIDMLLNNIKSLSDNLNNESISINECVKDALNTFPLRPGDIGRFDVKTGDDFAFQGDSLVIRQVLHNLIKNSLHFTHDAENPVIEVWSETDHGQGTLHFKDYGAGIKPSNLAHIFDPFFSKRKHGTGIGLSFCKMAMRKLGGDITCTSELNKYTHIILTFPNLTQVKL